MAEKNKDKDDWTLFDHYTERQRQSRERNPTRSVGDPEPTKDKKDKR